MAKDIKIRNMNFPSHDSNWTEIIELLKANDWSEVATISPVEFCNELDNCFPYEWSYWNDLSQYRCVIVHKGMYDRLKNDFLENLEENHDYVFGNAVFNVYILSSLNTNKLKGHEVHFSLNTIIQAVKKLLKIGKQFKAKSDKKNILLVTANHSGNIGDDAITLASQDILQSIYPDANIVIDKGPASKELISKVDLVVLGGGGIFYDDCFYNAQNYCQYLLYANECRVKSCGIGIGAQGIVSKYGIELYKKSLSFSEFIIVREKDSYSILVDSVKTSTPIIISRDVVFSLQFNTIKPCKKVKEKKTILFSLVEIDQTNLNEKATSYTNCYIENQFKCIEYLSKNYNVKCLVQSHDDLSLYEQFQKTVDIEIIKVDYNNVKDIMNLYKCSDLIMTSRLHGFIFTALAQTPLIIVSFENPITKLAGLINLYFPSALNSFLPFNQYSLENLKGMLDTFHLNPSKLTVALTEVERAVHKTTLIKTEFHNRIGRL